MKKLIAILLVTTVILTFSACKNNDNLSTLIGVSQEEVYEKIGNPQETLNEIDVYTINGKSVNIGYDEKKHVNQINFNGEYVINHTK